MEEDAAEGRSPSRINKIPLALYPVDRVKQYLFHYQAYPLLLDSVQF